MKVIFNRRIALRVVTIIALVLCILVMFPSLKSIFNTTVHVAEELEQLRKSDKMYKTKEYSHRRLGIVTINTPPHYPTWSNWTIYNHKQYAKKHGYGMYIENGKSDPRSPVWSKITALLRHMEDDRHDWVAYF